MKCKQTNKKPIKEKKKNPCLQFCLGKRIFVSVFMSNVVLSLQVFKATGSQAMTMIREQSGLWGPVYLAIVAISWVESVFCPVVTENLSSVTSFQFFWSLVRPKRKNITKVLPLINMAKYFWDLFLSEF